MKNKIFGGLTVLVLLAGAVWAEAPKAEKKPVLAEKTGVLSVQKADAEKNEKYDTILLKAGEESIKLLPGPDKKVFKPLDKMAGKTIAVKGEYLTPKPPKYPLAALKVHSFSEIKTAPAAKK